MNLRASLCIVIATTAICGARVAAAADATVTATTTAPAPAITADAVRPAMAEVFRPAPVPGEDEHPSGTRRVADAGPSLHPDLLSTHERSDGVLGNTDIAYDRNQRMRPAGGMSLDIPMQ
jgi:hypothetical protein